MSMNVNTDGNFTVVGMVWIDWNGDGDFDDAGESYEMGTAQNTADGITSNGSVSVSVPGSSNGTYRIRVSARYSSAERHVQLVMTEGRRLCNHCCKWNSDLGLVAFSRIE